MASVHSRRGAVPPGAAGGERGPHTDAELDALLRRVQERWPWGAAVERMHVTHAWSSRTAHLYRCSGDETPIDVVVKIAAGWDAAGARAVADAARSLDQALVRHGARVRVPRVLGWDASPPAVVTEHVAGTDLFFLFADLGHPAWAAAGDPGRLARACGRAVAAYHRSAPRRGDPDIRMHPRTLRAALRPATAAATAASFGDLGAHQLRLSTGGRLYLLDAPPDPPLAPVHRDLAAFTFGMDKVLGTLDRREADLSRLRRDLTSSFLAGYAEDGPFDPDDATDRRLFALYRCDLAAGTARRRLRERRYAAAARHGREWVSHLVRAVRRGP